MVIALKPHDISVVIKDLSEVLRAAREETEFELPQNDAALSDSWQRLVQNGMGRAYGLYPDNAWARGIFLGIIAPDTLTGILHGYECLWAVEPGFRGHALKLLRAFERDCKAAGCKVLVCSATDGPTLSRLSRIYLRRGFRPVAHAYMKNL